MKLESWAHWAEILASFAVVASLVFLTIEIGENTRAVESQAVRDRAVINDAYADSPLIPGILAKIKAVDGPESLEVAYMERYGLSYEEATIWSRALSRGWSTLEAQFVRDGPSQELQDRVQLFLLFPDGQLYWDIGNAIQIQNDDFREYVARARSGELPYSDWVSDYREELESLRVEWVETRGTAQ